MKKNYILFSLLVSLSAMNAQFLIDFDNMSLGNVSPQSSHIVLWPANGVTDAQVTTEQAFSGNQSIVMREQPGNDTFDDILVNLGNRTSGVWSVTWMMYVPAGKNGFWNIQEHESVVPAPRWNGQFFVGLSSSGGNIGEITFDQDDSVFVEYSSNEWFRVTHVIDLDNGTHTVDIDGTLLLDNFTYQGTDGGQGATITPSQQLGSVNFFSIDTNSRFYIDDFALIEGDVLSTQDFTRESISFYPNPVNDILNIVTTNSVNKIVVYNTLGSIVMQIEPNTISPSINFNELKSGIYFVEVTTGNSTISKKVIKK